MIKPFVETAYNDQSPITQENYRRFYEERSVVWFGLMVMNLHIDPGSPRLARRKGKRLPIGETQSEGCQEPALQTRLEVRTSWSTN